MNIRTRLHKLLFPHEHAAWRNHQDSIDFLNLHYTSLVNSALRQPVNDTPWMDKFLTLDKDYTALEKETAGLRRAVEQYSSFLKGVLRTDR